MNTKSERLYIRMPVDRLSEVKKAADEAGITYTQFGGMLVWMGFKSYQRQVNPEELFSPEQLVKMAEVYEQSQTNNAEHPAD